MGESSYETATDELRQVLVEEKEYTGGHEDDWSPTTRVRFRYYRLQRKWLVPTGAKSYQDSPNEPRSPFDLNINPQGNNLAYMIPIWLPRKAVWRDVPIVTEEEAGKDSQ